ncbi:MAG: TPM domain-containing protein [Bacteroidia bacterium]|nr:TPM domain-containing protein [Bacteroidia bacterium]
MNPKDFLGKENERLIKEAIGVAEHQTSGEIRVHLEESCKNEVLDRAAWLFKKLDMHKTKDRNGVLIYLSTKDRKFAIIGDIGINKVVPEGFWNAIKENMISHFTKGEFAEGIIDGIKLTGEQLKQFFPFQTDDTNELSDEISFGK